MAYNTGAYQSSLPAPAASLGASGAVNFSGGGSSVGVVFAVALIALTVLYVSTHGIQGSV